MTVSKENTLKPRSGWLGEWDKFIGPGATTVELVLIWLASVMGGAGMVAYALLRDLQWSWWQLVLAAVLAVDIGGGVVANAAAPAKRWYHRQGQGVPDHLLFAAVHVIHLALVWLLFPGGTAQFAIFWFVYLMLAAVVILQFPLSLQRPVAFLLFGVALVFNQYVLVSAAGFEWLVPLLFLKLLLGHLLHEEPYDSVPPDYHL